MLAPPGGNQAATTGIIAYREEREMKLLDPSQTLGFSKFPFITTKELKKNLPGRAALILANRIIPDPTDLLVSFAYKITEWRVACDP